MRKRLGPDNAKTRSRMILRGLFSEHLTLIPLTESQIFFITSEKVPVTKVYLIRKALSLYNCWQSYTCLDGKSLAFCKFQKA